MAIGKQSEQEPSEGDVYSNLFDSMPGLVALNKLQDLSFKGQKAVEEDPENLKIIRAVAALTNDQINAWANTMASDHDHEKILFYIRRAEDLRDQCRDAFGLPEVKPTIH
jgi:hypothetical protein